MIIARHNQKKHFSRTRFNKQRVSYNRVVFCPQQHTVRIALNHAKLMPLNASFHLISRIFCEILLFMRPSWRHLRRRFGMKIQLKGTCQILLKICTNFIKKWTPAKLFSCDYCEIFLLNIRKKQKRKINFMKNEL